MRPMGDYQMAWVHGVVGAAGPGGTLPELLAPEEAAMEDEDAEDAQGGIFIGAALTPQHPWALPGHACTAGCT